MTEFVERRVAQHKVMEKGTDQQQRRSVRYAHRLLGTKKTVKSMSGGMNLTSLECCHTSNEKRPPRTLISNHTTAAESTAHLAHAQPTQTLSDDLQHKSNRHIARTLLGYYFFWPFLFCFCFFFVFLPRALKFSFFFCGICRDEAFSSFFWVFFLFVFVCSW